jgi:hypothetical protein
MDNQVERLIAAEEVLAEMAQTNPQSGFVQRAIAAIRKWLRENIPGFMKMRLTDGEIIEHYLIPARQFVLEGSRNDSAADMAVAFTRKEEASFAKAVDDVLDHKSNAAIYIGNTPHALRQATLPKRPLWVTKRVIDKLYREHGLSREKIKSLPQLLSNPIMVLDSEAEPGKFVVLTTETHKGKPVIATIKPHGEIERVGPFNVVTSAYEKPHKLIADWMLGGKLIASDHEKALAWITTQELKLLRRTPEVTVAPESDRTGRGGSILQQLQEAVRKSLPINVTKDGGDVNRPVFSRSATIDTAGGSIAPTIAPAGGSIATPFRDRMARIVDSLIYNFQDRFKPLKDIQKRAGDVPEAMDAALAEELYSGKVRSRIDDFEAQMGNPLMKAIHESGVSYDDVQEFLHARHAPSRNKAMREINPTDASFSLHTHTDSPVYLSTVANTAELDTILIHNLVSYAKWEGRDISNVSRNLFRAFSRNRIGYLKFF